MKRGEAFAAQGVPRINRRQWHAAAEDDVQVVSIWEENLHGDSAEAHVHKLHFEQFSPGTVVRAVIQRGHRSGQGGHMVFVDAEPDSRDWTVSSTEVTPNPRGRRPRLLHVVRLMR